MEENRAFTKMYLMVSIVLGLSSKVGAVDITFFVNTGACNGLGYTFSGISSQSCSSTSAPFGGSVLFRDMDSCKISLVYRGGRCDSLPVGSERGNFCHVGGAYTSGKWYQSCRRRSLLGEVTSDVTKCVNQAKPTGLVFIEDSAKGSWILKSPNAVEFSSQIENMTDAEKLNWFKSNGASFENTSVTQTVNVNLH